MSEMTSEARQIADKIERNIRLLIAELAGVPDGDLNRALEVQPSNTLYQLGVHTLGSARYWAISLAGGTDYRRDRPAEFVSAGEGAPLLADLEAFVGELRAQVEGLTSGQLDGPVTPSAHYRSGTVDADSLVLRASLLHAIEHTALHLGHAQITRQLLGFEPVNAD